MTPPRSSRRAADGLARRADRTAFLTSATLSLLPITSTYMDLMGRAAGDGMTADESLRLSAVMLMEPEQ